MSRLTLTDYTADFIRGWPNDGALESSSYPIATGQELEAGDLVILNGSGQVIKTTTETNFSGIVVRGNKDDKSVGASGKAIVLWSGYIVRTTKIAAGAFAPMDPVVSAAGVFDAPGTPTVNPLGYVLEYSAGGAGVPATAVIVVR